MAVSYRKRIKIAPGVNIVDDPKISKDIVEAMCSGEYLVPIARKYKYIW